jgi:hypothetical protein
MLRARLAFTAVPPGRRKAVSAIMTVRARHAPGRERGDMSRFLEEMMGEEGDIDVMPPDESMGGGGGLGTEITDEVTDSPE